MTTSDSSGTQSPRLHTRSGTDAYVCGLVFISGNLHSKSCSIAIVIVNSAARKQSQMAVWLPDTPPDVLSWRGPASIYTEDAIHFQTDFGQC